MNTGTANPSRQAARLGSVEEFISIYDRPGTTWCLLRLAGTDTSATEARLAGPTLPRDLLLRLFPGLGKDDNGKGVFVDALLPRQGLVGRVQVVVYTKIYFEKVREESRLCGWGRPGAAVVGAAATGALAAFVFEPAATNASRRLAVWICEDATEEAILEQRAGAVQPGVPVVMEPSGALPRVRRPAPDLLAAQVSDSAPLRSDIESRLLSLHTLALDRTSGSRAGAGDDRNWCDRLLACLLARTLSERGLTVHAVPGDSESEHAVEIRPANSPPVTIRVCSIVRYDAPAGAVFTLQQGVPDVWFADRGAGTQLVVPSVHLPTFPRRMRSRIHTLEQILPTLG